MQTVLYIIQKEFLQIFRNRLMLGFILFAPVFQLFVLAYAATFEIRNINLFIVDQDKSMESRALVERFSSSENFQITGLSDRASDGDQALLRNDAVMVLQIPPHAGRSLVRYGHAPVSIRLDAVDGFSANIAGQYAMQIIMLHNEVTGWTVSGPDFPLQSTHFRVPDQPFPALSVLEAPFISGNDADITQQNSAAPKINISVSRWFNPDLDYKTYMVPGILVLLITVIGGFLTGMNVVREKELGTMEQLNVTPITRTQFVIGKLTPFLILALVMFSFGLLLARFWFEIPFEGGIGLIYIVATTYLLVVLGLGLLVSTIARTQQQAIFITWFIFVIFILLSGLFTPIDSMPDWAQVLTWVNPVAWFIDIIRRVMLTGADLWDIWTSYAVLLTYGILIIGFAMVRYRKYTT